MHFVHNFGIFNFSGIIASKVSRQPTNNLFLFLIFMFAGRFGRLIITSKDGDRNLIRSEVFQELRILDAMVQNATATYDGESFTYQDICARKDGYCFENSILYLNDIMDDVSFKLNNFHSIVFLMRICFFFSRYFADFIRQNSVDISCNDDSRKF